MAGTAAVRTDPATPPADRLERARAALTAAEAAAARWGGGTDRSAWGRGREAPGPAPTSPAAPAAPGAAPERTPARSGAAPDPTGAVLPVPAALVPLLPQGLRAGSSVRVEGSSALLLALAAAATGQERWCAVVGMADLGLRSAVEAGLDPTRLALVPDPGEAPGPILSALVDGVGVVVLGPGIALPPALSRSLLDRARTRDALVLAAAPALPVRTDHLLRAAPGRWEGLGGGHGRLRARRTLITATGRSTGGRERVVEVLLPGPVGALAAVPGADRAAQPAAPGADRGAGLALLRGTA
jgi:hypothetical protein